jgi:hypothetical protein
MSMVGAKAARDERQQERGGARDNAECGVGTEPSQGRLDEHHFLVGGGCW